MALLTQTTHNVQLAPVMSSEHWKRPWTEVDNQSKTSYPHSPPTLPSLQSGLQATNPSSPYTQWRRDGRQETYGASPSSVASRGPETLSHQVPETYSPVGKRQRLEGPGHSPVYASRNVLDSDPRSRRDYEGYAVPHQYGNRTEKELGDTLLSASSGDLRTSDYTPRSPRRERGSMSKSINETLPFTRCAGCNKASNLAPKLVQGLAKLHSDLATIWSSNPPAQNIKELPSSQENRVGQAPKGWLDSLDWSLEKLNDSIDLARGMLGSKRFQEQDYHTRDLDTHSHTMNMETGDKRDEPGMDLRYGQHSPLGSDQGSRHPETLPPILDRYQPPSMSSQSSTGTYQRDQVPQSPLHTSNLPRSSLPPLPSPSSLSYSGSSTVLPVMSPSTLPQQTLATNAQQISGTSGTSCNSNTDPHSPRTAHLQDLQHQLSTKSLAHTILKSEHENLLAALQRHKTRASTLDRKAVVSDTEIGNLIEEKLRLQADLDCLQASLDEAQYKAEDDEARVQRQEDQWLTIVRNSKRLDGQWRAEQITLRERINELEAKLGVPAEERFAAISPQSTVPQQVPTTAQPITSSFAPVNVKMEPEPAPSIHLHRPAPYVTLTNPAIGTRDSAPMDSTAVKMLTDQLNDCRASKELAEEQVRRYQSLIGSLTQTVGTLDGLTRGLYEVGAGEQARRS